MSSAFPPGWADVAGRAPAQGRPDPKSVYTPRVDGVMPEPLGLEEGGEPGEEEDDNRVPVDVLILRRVPK